MNNFNLFFPGLNEPDSVRIGGGGRVQVKQLLYFHYYNYHYHYRYYYYYYYYHYYYCLNYQFIEELENEVCEKETTMMKIRNRENSPFDLNLKMVITLNILYICM